MNEKQITVELSEVEAQFVEELLNKYSGKRGCPPGCVIASEVARRIESKLREIGSCVERTNF